MRERGVAVVPVDNAAAANGRADPTEDAAQSRTDAVSASASFLYVLAYLPERSFKIAVKAG